MINIDLNVLAVTITGNPLTGVDGKPTGQSYGQVVAEMLAMSSSGNSRKRYSWAKKLHANEELSLDGEDFDMLFKAVNDSPLFDFIKAPVLDLMIDARQVK